MSNQLSLFRKIGLFLGPLVFVVILLIPTIPNLNTSAQYTLAILAWMLIWWISEVVYLGVTALLPILLFPVLGVLDLKATTAPYANPIIFLFMGGFMIALALEKWKLHLRIALNIVKLTGTNANGIILGFMLATFFLSMWISNTATTVMMLPIASSVILLLVNSQKQENKGNIKNFSLTLMLGIAYAANIGGVATIIGTPPNSFLASFLSEKYNYEIDFTSWLIVAFPFAIILLFVVYFLFIKLLYPNGLGNFEEAEELIKIEVVKLGKPSMGEKLTFWVFFITALLWIFRTYINHLLGINLSDSSIAIMASIALFVIPESFQKGVFLLEWKDTQKLPWDILLLFGGGLSLANALAQTGLMKLIADGMLAQSTLNFFWIITILVILVVFATEVIGNIALVSVMIPLVASMASSLGQEPLSLLVPITMAASCAFMLPMATPPNAIVFASGYIKVSQMVRAGFLFNVLALLWIIIISQTLVPWIFG